MSNKYYMVYDGRAHTDEDSASILECIGETTREKAIAEFKNSWGDTDSILFEYDISGETLSNGVPVNE